MTVDPRDPTVICAVAKAYIRAILDTGSGEILAELARQGQITFSLSYDDATDEVQISATGEAGSHVVWTARPTTRTVPPLPADPPKAPRLS